MLSKKMTFSLMSLIIIFALAFVFVVPSEAQFKTTLTRTSSNVAGAAVTVNIKFDKQVTLAAVQGTAIVVTIVHSDFTTPVYTQGAPWTSVPAAAAGLADFAIAAADTDATMAGIQSDGMTFTLTIPATALPVTAGPPRVVPKTVYVTVPAGVNSLDPADSGADSMSKAASTTIQLRDLPAAGDALPQNPQVVSIQRLRPGSQSVVAAFQEEQIPAEPFNVRIVLSEAANGIDLAKAENLVRVENATVSNLIVGAPFASKWVAAPAAANAPTRAEQLGILTPHPIEGMYHYNAAAGTALGLPPPVAGQDTDPVPPFSGPDGMYHQFQVTVTPHTKRGTDPFNVKIGVKAFHDNGSPTRITYVPPGFGDSPHLVNGRDILTISVKPVSVNVKAGYRVAIPKDIYIPGGGYLIVAKDKGGSAIDTSGQDADRTNDPPRATFRTPAQMLYNVHVAANLPNLATQFLNGVVVDVESGNKLYITEVMWGEDVSLIVRTHSQWIELYNPGDGFKTPDDDASTADVDERLTLVFYAPNEFSSVAAATTDATTGAMTLPGRVVDRIGTLDAKGAYWSPTSKGQSGASGIANVDETGDLERTVTPAAAIVPVVSMYRAMVPDTSAGAAVGAMMVADGQMAANWMSSAGPKSANFTRTAIGIRHGTPGAATDATDTPADTAAEAKAKADAAAAAAKKTASTGTIPQNGSVYISEIMVAGGGTLPQWIEIANGSKSEEVNLSGWTLTISNAAADADVSIGASAKFTIADGTMLGMGGQQTSPSTILVVTEAGRNNVDSSGQVINLMKDNEVDLILAGVTTRKYTLLSDMAFSITLAPPEPAKSTPPAGETADAKAKRMAAEKKAAAMRKAASDTVGNLGADGAAAWALPMSEDGRSSIIRKHVQVAVGPAEPEDGTMAGNWVLASDTAFAQPTHIRAQSYYGAMNDIGTPGFRAGGALPVELSHFRPERKKETGEVVITWSTQSELNNAGFFVKRSQQKDGEFKVINATMVPGAGTTSEKQFYTYTDTTAQPNVVYYYQIEDVSLDGNRQTLTRGIRLKGHVSVAGKATITWGELKTSHE